MINVEQTPGRRTNKRALTSLLMFFSFLWLVPSGITVHLAAAGPTEPLYHVSMAAHVAGSVVFLAAIVVHLLLNWKPMMHHMTSKTKEYMAFSREAIIALVIVTAMVLLIASHVVFLG